MTPRAPTEGTESLFTRRSRAPADTGKGDDKACAQADCSDDQPAGAKLQERSFAANAALSAFAWVVPAVAALIAIPITVRGLGAEQYGLLALTAALTGYLGLMELGLGSAILRYLSYYRALGQGRPMRGILWFALRWFCAAGVVGGIFLWAAAPWLSSSVLDLPPELQQTAVVVLRITGVNFLLALVLSVGMAIPQSFLRYDIASAMSGSMGLLAAVGPAIIVSLGYGLVAVVSYSLALNAVGLLIYGLVGLRLMRLVSSLEGPPWQEIRRKTLSFAGMTALNSIGDNVAIQTNRLVVGIASGVAAAAYYQVPLTLATRVGDLLSRVGQVIFPTASGLLAKKDTEGVRILYLRTSRLFFAVSLSVGMGLAVLGYPLLRYWVAPAYAAEGALALAFFAMSQALHGATMSASYINLSAARPGINVAFSNGANAINLLLVYPLTVRFGVSGAALAGLIAAANVPIFLAFSHRRVLHLSSWLVWRRCYQPTVLGASLIGALGYFIVRPVCSSLTTTLVAWCLLVLASIAMSGVLGAIKREDIRTARRLAASLRGRMVASLGR